MNSSFGASFGALDNIRRLQGADACKKRFQALLKDQDDRAARLLNDTRLRFATLFLLRPQIEESRLGPQLSDRNRAALQICGKVLKEQKAPPGGIDYSDPKIHAAFSWMFRTGAESDGMSNEFDEVIDLCASVLTRRYRETFILPALTGLIFRRNRKKLYLHDLIWALFQADDPNALRYIARYLRSANARDRELARLLLHLPASGESSFERESQYRKYLGWLHENSAFLYLTGESLQGSNQPEICHVDLGAKYLGKQISPRSRTPLHPLNPREEESLSCFAKAEERDRTVLSQYSKSLRSRSPAVWNRWIRLPVEKQLEIAQDHLPGRRLI